jgi:hypothetical protein
MTKYGSTLHPGHTATFNGTHGLTFSWPTYSTIGLIGVSHGSWSFESLRLNLRDLLGSNITVDMGVRIWAYISNFPLATFEDNINYAIIGLDTGPNISGGPTNPEWNMAILRDYNYRQQRHIVNQGSETQLSASDYGDHVIFDSTQAVQLLEIPRIMDWESHVYTGQMVSGTWPDFSAMTLVQSIMPPPGMFVFGQTAGGPRMMPINGNQNIWNVVLGAGMSSMSINDDLTVSYGRLKIEVRK